MSRRRLERGFWKGRKVEITDKEHGRLYVWHSDRLSYYHRHEMMITMDWPWPTEFKLEHRLARKTKKALWKAFNGHRYSGHKVSETMTSVIHNGHKKGK